MDTPLQQLIDFAALHRDALLESTGYTEVEYTGILYNVSGSSGDPHLGGSWKQLLESKGIGGDCYVTAPVPSGQATSHPQFSVGGHMTPDPHGNVGSGGICYLMPLCHWHNSTARDRTAFQHQQTRMLRLSGYLKGEFFGSFIARLPDDSAGRLISIDGNSLRASDLDPWQLETHERRVIEESSQPQLLFRKVKDQGRVRFRLTAIGCDPVI